MRHMNVTFTNKMLKEIEEMGAKFYGVWAHSVDKNDHRDKLLIGYGNLSEIEIEKGITILAEYLFK